MRCSSCDRPIVLSRESATGCACVICGKGLFCEDCVLRGYEIALRGADGPKRYAVFAVCAEHRVLFRVTGKPAGDRSVKPFNPKTGKTCRACVDIRLGVRRKTSLDHTCQRRRVRWVL